MNASTNSSSEMGAAIHHRITKLVLLTREHELPHKQGVVHGACFSNATDKLRLPCCYALVASRVCL